MYLYFKKKKCTSNSDCKTKGKAVCDTTSGDCVQCINTSDCSNGKVCKNNVCVSKGGCQSNKDCTSKGLNVCNVQTGKCVQCTKTNELACNINEFCSNGYCVSNVPIPCAKNADCSSQTPCCYKSSCVECTSTCPCTGKDEICYDNICLTKTHGLGLCQTVKFWETPLKGFVCQPPPSKTSCETKCCVPNQSLLWRGY